MSDHEFREYIWDQSSRLYRDMPWRRDTRPYYILVSELMLQQTQVARVMPKFDAFITRFPDERALADANLSDVLRAWQGLGYNRRAKYLHDAAKKIVSEWAGVWPETQQELQQLPGVGLNTAGAIAAYAFNYPSVFVETNIRTVYFLHFFADTEHVDDTQVRRALQQTLDLEYPREFYWALMDYGADLKAQGMRNSRQSKHYKKQSPLEGSVRQVRGEIIRKLTHRDMSDDELRRAVEADARYPQALDGLVRDGLVTRVSRRLHLTK